MMCLEREECSECPYSCDYDTIYDGDGSSRLTNFKCLSDGGFYPYSFESKSSVGVILGKFFDFISL